jgi:hypothetical protein
MEEVDGRKLFEIGKYEESFVWFRETMGKYGKAMDPSALLEVSSDFAKTCLVLRKIPEVKFLFIYCGFGFILCIIRLQSVIDVAMA